MRMDLDFTPDVIIHFLKNTRNEMCIPPTHYINIYWGDKNIYDYGRDYIHSLLKDNKDCFFFTVKGLAKYQIIEGTIHEK